MEGEFKPLTAKRYQDWGEILSRTLTCNDLVNKKAIHKAREQKENFSKTLRTLDPNRQDLVDCLGNKITGCRKKSLRESTLQTFKIGDNYGLPEQDPGLNKSRTAIMKSEVFAAEKENLKPLNKTSFLIVHPNVLRSESAVR